MDTLNPGSAWTKRDDRLVVRKVYSEEFRRDAVELYRTTEGSTVASIAADLGIMDTTLSSWLKAAGVPIRDWPGSAPGSRSWKRTSGSSVPSGTSCARRPSISPGRRAGDPLPVRRRPPERLRGEADVPAGGDSPRLVLRLGSRRRRACGPPPGRRAAGQADPGGARRRAVQPRVRGAAGERRAQRRRRPREPGESQAGRPGDGGKQDLRDPAASAGPHPPPRARRPG